MLEEDIQWTFFLWCLYIVPLAHFNISHATHYKATQLVTVKDRHPPSSIEGFVWEVLLGVRGSTETPWPSPSEGGRANSSCEGRFCEGLG